MQHPDALMAILMGLLGGTVLVCLWRARRGRVPYIRRIPGIVSLEEAVERATEMGKPIVFAIGASDINNIETHAALAILAHVARLSARLRARLIAVTCVANVYPVMEEVVRQAYVTEGVPEQLNTEKQVRYLSQDLVVYAMGTAQLIEEMQAGSALFFGSFYYVSLLLTEPGARLGVMQIAGDPSLWQVPFFVCTCDYTIIGEEYFAAGAYLSPDPSTRGSLVSQDIIKGIFAAMLVIGVICAQLAGDVPQWIVGLLKAYNK